MHSKIAALILFRTKFFLVGLFTGAVAACTTPPAPQLDYAFAREAFDAARAVDSARLSPGHFHQAEEIYRRAQAAFEQREYKEARELFQQAKMVFEKAENSARLIRFKTGEVL